MKVAHGRRPGGDYWEPKLARNVARDRENVRALEAAGWQVLRFYEHVAPRDAAAAVARAVSD